MKKMKNNKGFTLLEIVIAMLLLSIASLAVISMQVASLKGYVSLRDNDEAVQIAQRTADYLNISALQWRAPDGLYSTNSLDPYAPANGTPFDEPNPLAQVNATSNWISLFDLPVDTRLSNQVATSGTVFGGKHCVFIRGEAALAGLNVTVDGGGAVTSSPMMRVQIAVIAPGPNQQLSDCADIDTGLIDVAGEPLGETLQVAGFRPYYYGTIVTRRDYMQ